MLMGSSSSMNCSSSSISNGCCCTMSGFLMGMSCAPATWSSLSCSNAPSSSSIGTPGAYSKIKLFAMIGCPFSVASCSTLLATTSFGIGNDVQLYWCRTRLVFNDKKYQLPCWLPDGYNAIAPTDLVSLELFRRPFASCTCA